MRNLMIGVAASLVLAGVASAEAPTPAKFVSEAGASDLFEMDSAKLMESSKNPKVAAFAAKMLVDHGKSTSMVKMAAKADGLAPKAPDLSIGQRTDLTALKAVPAGKTKDDLYIKQQKAAHADALALVKSYAASGTATHLKSAAAKIAPVVQSHIAKLDAM